METQLDANWVPIDVASRMTGVPATSILAWCAAGAVRSIAQTSGRVVDLAAVRFRGMPATTAPEAITARLADRDPLTRSETVPTGPSLNETILELQDIVRDHLDR